MASAPFYTALQKAVPDRLHGRVFGVQSTLSGFILPVGRAITGGVLDYFSARSIFIVMGALYLINALMSSLIRGNMYKSKNILDRTSQKRSF